MINFIQIKKNVVEIKYCKKLINVYYSNPVGTPGIGFGRGIQATAKKKRASKLVNLILN